MHRNRKRTSSGRRLHLNLSLTDHSEVEQQRPANVHPQVITNSLNDSSLLVVSSPALNNSVHLSEPQVKRQNTLLSCVVPLPLSQNAARDTTFSSNNDTDFLGALTPADSPKAAPSFQQASADNQNQHEEKITKTNVKKIGNFELIGPTYYSSHQSVDIENGRSYVCQVLSKAQYDQLVRVTSRLNDAEKFWKMADVHALREAVLPRDIKVVTDNDQRYMFTPVNEGSLHGYVQMSRRENWTESDTRLMLFSQIVRIVAFCHRLGIVVRDLKLRKFVFVDRPQTKLRLNGVLDVTVLNKTNEDWLRGRHGCPAYVSPEILNVHAGAYSGKAADMWSVGVLLFVLLTGRYPFYDTTPRLLFYRIRNGHFHIPLSVGQPFRALIYCLLHQDPQKRPNAEAVLALPWLVNPRNSQQSSITSAVHLIGQKHGKVAARQNDDQLVPAVELDASEI